MNVTQWTALIIADKGPIMAGVMGIHQWRQWDKTTNVLAEAAVFNDHLLSYIQY